MTGTPNPAAAHLPVLLDEVLAALAPKDGGIYVDGTFGLGGYTRALLESADCRVLGIDRDPDAVARGADLAARFPGRLTLRQARFGDMAEVARADGIARVDGVALDLGVSSPQLDEAGRGFSFRFDGPLDMRMEKAGPSAADLANTLPEGELADLISDLGEERHARRVARAIVAARPLATTGELAAVVRRAVPRSGDGIDPATRTFQALRLAVNDELGELDRGLAAAETLLTPGGRLAAVSFHSLEDRRVKSFLAARSGTGSRPSRHLPETDGSHEPTFRLLSRKPVRAQPAEIDRNSRARSARLRAAERTSAPAQQPR
ncbi:MAG: 16S rRNA (cytosine(1402)-N(4))-methyltransferase RsmH [Alphaproteobacteria bacterium]|nr:16S rRNA (cytosine(1402)-N(4))-methyltransferase RsmH [Alphaproteobacteria bacterium]